MTNISIFLRIESPIEGYVRRYKRISLFVLGIILSIVVYMGLAVLIPE